MGLVTRPTKGGGTTQYTTEVAAGFTFAEAAEVDADLNTIYTVVNGNLDDANIKLGANIAGSKLADGTLPGAKLTDGTVTTAKLNNLAVTVPKLAVGSSIAAQVSAAMVQGISVVDTTETTVCSLPLLGTRGGFVILYIPSAIRCYLDASSPTAAITLRVKRNGITFDTLQFGPRTVVGTDVHCFLPALTFVNIPIASGHLYTVTCQLNVAGFGGFFTPSAPCGTAWAIEHA